MKIENTGRESAREPAESPNPRICRVCERYRTHFVPIECRFANLEAYVGTQCFGRMEWKDADSR